MSIKNIRMNVDELQRSRCKSVKNLLHPIVYNKHSQAFFFTTGNDNIRIVTFSENPNKRQELRDVRFKLVNNYFQGMYYEIWRRINKTNDFELEKMYFHLYNSYNEEYILLHCDPNDHDANHGNYKRSPHLHIEKSTETVIQKAHLALNMTDYEIVFENIDTLTASFKAHIIMLKEQILDSRK